MPGCAAVGCNNRSEKGFIMKCFPRDSKLRKIWQERVARADWEPSNNSFLCQVHFEPDEWYVLPNGKLKLKKNAVPSIFTITSTRKSPKKRVQMSSYNQHEYDDDFLLEYVENDTEHSSIDHPMEEKDSDSQDNDEPSVKSFVYQQLNHSLNITNDKQVSPKQYINVTGNLQQENIIIISDDNIEIKEHIKECFDEKNVEDKTSVDNGVEDENLTNNEKKLLVKTEIKRETDQTSTFDSYDEIEEKLKQICDGDRAEGVSNNVERVNSSTCNNQDQEEVLEKSITQTPLLHRTINYNRYSSKDELGSLLTDETENIEIIFGSESGEECSRVSKCTSYDTWNNGTAELVKIDQQSAVIIPDNQEINKNCPEAVERVFQGETIHVTPNMRAALKRKRRTREEIMKSIKKSMRIASPRDSISDSDSDIAVKAPNEIKKELNTQFKDDVTPAAKFTVKVSGDREDIFDIMQDLSKDTKDFTIQECNDTTVHKGNNTFVTSIITIDDSLEEDITSRTSDQVSFNLTPIKSEFSSRRLMSLYCEEENDSHVNSYSKVNNEQSAALYTLKQECRKLRQKVKVQENVIDNLTKQLILYKNCEKNKNVALEVKLKKMENMKHKFNTKTDGTSTAFYKKSVDLKQKLIDDLTSRVNYLEETNNKLMKTVTLESQCKRKLEGQIKQKDNRIKELNWKLQKASKFFDRAEKNTNTYRRKMLNMQTFMRRKKLLDEKMSRFNEMLVENVKDGYTDKAMLMAMEIKEMCGSSAYDKLLDFGFPLPSLLTLRSPRHNHSSDSANESPLKRKRNVNEETDYGQCANNDYAEASTSNQVLDSVCEEMDVTDNTEETVMGTVQDIFEENNDVDNDDFGTNELREHFMLQLNAVM